jgi:hypothetical protein
MSVFSAMSDMEDEKAPFVGGIYGPAGSGKTTVAMELAQRITEPDKKIVYAFTNQGWTSLKNFPPLMKRTKKLPYESFDQIAKLCEGLRQPKIREATKIGTVVFDEFNTMFDMNIEALTNFRSWQAANPQPGDKKGAYYKDPDTPEWPEYNTAKMHMINLMNDALATPDVNFIFVAHPRFQKKTGFVEPDLFEKASQAFMRVLHSLYYLSVEEQGGKLVRTIQLQGTDQVVAKNRIGGLPNSVTSVAPIAEAYKVWAEAKKNKKTSTEAVSAVVRGSSVEETPVEKPFPPVAETPPEASPQEVTTPKDTTNSGDELMSLLGI